MDDIDHLTALEAAGTTVCLVSKNWEEQRILELHAAGFRRFAESRVAALAERASSLPADIEWHFVGNLQRRDLSAILQHASMTQSFDRIDLLDRLAGSGVEFLLQINITGEHKRNGILAADLPAALDAIGTAGLSCSGLMAHPPLIDDQERTGRSFTAMERLLATNKVRHPSLRVLSMGTSADHELAIERGANMVRLGRLLSMD